MSGVFLLAPGAVFQDPNQQAVHANATVTASGSQVFTGYGAAEVTLFVNVKNAPTGTSPTLQYTIQEVDPGDGTTVIGNSVSTTSITAVGIQRITLLSTYGGSIKVSWTIGGSSPSFTGVYATLVAKAATALITDGTNTAAVKAASAPAVATDPALVVAISPNNSFTVSSALLADRQVTGTITAVNGTVLVNAQGVGDMGVQITGTWVATLVFEGTIDGSDWFSVTALPIGPGAAGASSTTANGQWRIMSSGCAEVRVRASAFTSGTVNVYFEGNQGASTTRAAQGAPNALANAWPVIRTDGTNVSPTADTAARAAFEKLTDGTNVAAVTAASALKVDGSAVTQPVSGTVTSNQGTPNTVGNSWPVEVTDGTNVLGTSAHPVRTDPTGTTTQPVSGTVTATQATAGNLNATVVQGAGSGAAATFWYVRVTDGTNALPTMDAVARAGFQKITDGTNGPVGVKAASTAAVASDPSFVTAFSPNSPLPPGSNVIGAVTQSGGPWTISGTVSQGTPNAIANRWPVQMTDGTNTMPTGDAVARAIFHKLTDGTNGPVAVKAPSTAAVAADPALVVAVSPNNVITTALAPDVTPATQNITALDVGSTTTTGANNQLIITGTPTTGSTASFAISTQETIQVQVTGTWSGAVEAEISPDGGTTWYLRKPHQSGASLPQTAEFTANFLGAYNVTGFTNFRIRALGQAWSGTATVRITESANTNIVFTSNATAQEVIPAIQHADAFHRMRVSQPVRQWSSMSEYPDFPFLWETAVTGTGSVTWEQYLSSQRLSTGGTGSTASAIRQTRRYMRYQPGKSTLILMTFVMSAAQTNAVAEIGYYDANNGVFLQRNGTTLNVIRRTNVTGTPTDNIVAQANWNLDRLDGTGPSGITLDTTKANILVIDMQWLGVGTVRIGFDFGGVVGPVWCHQFVNNNAFTTVYMSTGSLPMRGRVANTGTAGGTVTLDMICTAYANEGASQGRGVLDTDRVSTFSIGNGTTLRTTSSTGTPILSLRAATQYGGTGSGGQVNRGWIVPVNANIYSASVDCYYEIWAGGSLTGASWTVFGANSIADYDVSATSFTPTGGFLVVNGYVSSTKNAGTGGQFLTPYEIPLVYSGLNSTQDTVTMLVFMLTTGSNSAGATVAWEERY